MINDNGNKFCRLSINLDSKDKLKNQQLLPKINNLIKKSRRLSFIPNFEVREGDVCPEMTEVVNKWASEIFDLEKWRRYWRRRIWVHLEFDSRYMRWRNTRYWRFFFLYFSRFLKYGCDRFSKVISLTWNFARFCQ